VAAQVAAYAACPVVAIRGIPGRRCDMATFADRPVVVGFDGSEPAQRAVEYAVRQADQRRAELRAVLAWALTDEADTRPGVPIEQDLSEEQRRAHRMLDEALAGWAERFPDLRMTRHAVYDTDPVRILVDESHAAGIVVVGSRGGGGFLGLRLGSTVDGLIRHAHAPVAVVPGDAPR
jgi:nucleotide-binding universal stress UspA family protein